MIEIKDILIAMVEVKDDPRKVAKLREILNNEIKKKINDNTLR